MRAGVVLSDEGSIYARPLAAAGMDIVPCLEPGDIDHYNPDVLMFTGGEDVDPVMYGEGTHHTTYYNKLRCHEEGLIFLRAMRGGIKMCGICRGAQFLTAMAGGKLVQNIHGHAGIPHELVERATDFSDTGVIETVTSTHHQMMYPYVLPEKEYEVLAVGPILEEVDEPALPRNLPEGHKQPDLWDSVECVYYPGIKALAVQYHPEYMDVDSEGWCYYQHLLNKYILEYVG